MKKFHTATTRFLFFMYMYRKFETSRSRFTHFHIFISTELYKKVDIVILYVSLSSRKKLPFSKNIKNTPRGDFLIFCTTPSHTVIQNDTRSRNYLLVIVRVDNKFSISWELIINVLSLFLFLFLSLSLPLSFLLMFDVAWLFIGVLTFYKQSGMGWIFPSRPDPTRRRGFENLSARYWPGLAS